MAIVENTLQSLYDHTLFISGQNSSSLKIEDAVRLYNYALNEYSHLALSADGRWKAGDRLDNGLTVYTTAITGADNYLLQADFIKLDRVEVVTSDDSYVVEPIARKDSKTTPLSEAYSNGSKARGYILDNDVLTLYPNPTSGTLKIYPSLPFGHFESTTLTQEVGIPSIHMEFLVFHALHRLGLRLNDETRNQVRQELEVWTQKVRDHYNKRDEDTPRRLKGIINVTE